MAKNKSPSAREPLDTLELERLLDETSVPVPLIDLPEIDDVYDLLSTTSGPGDKNASISFTTLDSKQPGIDVPAYNMNNDRIPFQTMDADDQTVVLEAPSAVELTLPECEGFELSASEGFLNVNDGPPERGRRPKAEPLKPYEDNPAPVPDGVLSAMIQDHGQMLQRVGSELGTNLGTIPAGAMSSMGLPISMPMRVPLAPGMPLTSYDVRTIPPPAADVRTGGSANSSGSAGMNASGNAELVRAQSGDGTCPKLRFSKGAEPSKYCHVCGRSANTVTVAQCGNLRIGMCRKVLCEKCLILHEAEAAEWARQKGSGWTCTHCRGVCPPRARCHQYTKNNLRRRMRNNEKRRLREDDSDAAEEKRRRVEMNVGVGTGVASGVSPTGVADNVFGEKLS